MNSAYPRMLVFLFPVSKNSVVMLGKVWARDRSKIVALQKPSFLIYAVIVR